MDSTHPGAHHQEYRGLKAFQFHWMDSLLVEGCIVYDPISVFQFHWMDSTSMSRSSEASMSTLSIPLNGFLIHTHHLPPAWLSPYRLSIPLNGFRFPFCHSLSTPACLSIPLNGFLWPYSKLLSCQWRGLSIPLNGFSGRLALLWWPQPFNSIEWIPTRRYFWPWCC